MAIFTPGQFRKSLQEKIKQVNDPVGQQAAPIAIKNNSRESFTQQASTYAANEMRQVESSVQSPASTAKLPAGSFINKTVRERMQTMAKDLNSRSK